MCVKPARILACCYTPHVDCPALRIADDGNAAASGAPHHAAAHSPPKNMTHTICVTLHTHTARRSLWARRSRRWSPTCSPSLAATATPRTARSASGGTTIRWVKSLGGACRVWLLALGSSGRRMCRHVAAHAHTIRAARHCRTYYPKQSFDASDPAPWRATQQALSYVVVVGAYYSACNLIS